MLATRSYVWYEKLSQRQLGVEKLSVELIYDNLEMKITNINKFSHRFEKLR